MTTETYNAALGVSISAFTPGITAGTYTPAWHLVTDRLAQTADAYSHEIRANGGWWSASITISGSLIEMEDWFASGLNRHIEVYNSALELVWTGFVNMVTLSAGTLQVTRGPLIDIANRVSVTYTPILDATLAPPLEGSETMTTIADDAVSQAKYGILEQVVSGGKLLDDGITDDATQLRNTFLEENREPETGEEISLTASAFAIVQLELLGYVHRLKSYVYQDVVPVTVQISTKIEDVLAADPNGLFSTDYSRITPNALLTSAYDNDNRMAWDVIQELVNMGDAANNRYTFSVYDGQRAVYAAIPTTTAYQHRITGTNADIEIYGAGIRVQPADVLPARWLFLPDFLVGRTQPTDRRLDPRFLFIESVQFTAPEHIQINGQKVRTLPQFIARLSG